MKHGNPKKPIKVLTHYIDIWPADPIDQKDELVNFCPGCDSKFYRKGVFPIDFTKPLVFKTRDQETKLYFKFEYECPKCGMSYEMDTLGYEEIIKNFM
jgi:hypothetical protein